MDRYRDVLSPAAQRQLDRLRGSTFVAMRGVILGWVDEPLPPTVGMVSGAADLSRLRVRIDGVPWRVIYHLDAVQRVVVVTRVTRRDASTYRRLDG
jgi:mRNA-degrading endonuclease RelE of RelBE toxin-antitoxin system